MATYSKPAKVPRWADTTLNILEPPEVKKDEGWLFQEIPPSQFENWKENLTGLWFKWIGERIGDGDTADVLRILDPVDGVSEVFDISKVGDESHLERAGTIDFRFAADPEAVTWKLQFAPYTTGFFGANAAVWVGNLSGNPRLTLNAAGDPYADFAGATNNGRLRYDDAGDYFSFNAGGVSDRARVTAAGLEVPGTATGFFNHAVGIGGNASLNKAGDLVVTGRIGVGSDFEPDSGSGFDEGGVFLKGGDVYFASTSAGGGTFLQLWDSGSGARQITHNGANATWFEQGFDAIGVHGDGVAINGGLYVGSSTAARPADGRIDTASYIITGNRFCFPLAIRWFDGAEFMPGDQHDSDWSYNYISGWVFAGITGESITCPLNFKTFTRFLRVRAVMAANTLGNITCCFQQSNTANRPYSGATNITCVVTTNGSLALHNIYNSVDNGGPDPSHLADDDFVHRVSFTPNFAFVGAEADAVEVHYDEVPT